MDRNRHIHTWRCVYKRYKSFDEESASSNMLRKICSPLHFRVVDNYNGGSNGIQLFLTGFAEPSSIIVAITPQSLFIVNKYVFHVVLGLLSGKGDSML